MIKSSAIAFVFLVLVLVGSGVLAQGRGDDARAMQADDAANPAFLWVKRGEDLWHVRPGPDAKACADCHGAAEASMRGVSARYPRYEENLRRPLALDQKIDQCRTERQNQPRLTPENDDAIALAAYVGLQSRGMPATANSDGPSAAYFEGGRRLYETRMGQLNLSCAQCHDRLVGERLGGSIIPPARVAGYPIYRLDWQGMGSFARRLRGCMIGIRAEPFLPDSSERVMLEFYLAAREKDIVIETPAVRP